MKAKAPKETPAIVKAKLQIDKLEREIRDWEYTNKKKNEEILQLSIQAAGKEQLLGEIIFLRNLLREISLPEVALKMAENDIVRLNNGMVVHR